jgi:hypothetical protein
MGYSRLNEGTLGVLLCGVNFCLLLRDAHPLLEPTPIPRQQAFAWGGGNGLRVQCHKLEFGGLKAAKNFRGKGGVSGSAGQLGNGLDAVQCSLVTAGAAQARGGAAFGSRCGKHPKCPRLQGK